MTDIIPVVPSIDVDVINVEYEFIVDVYYAGKKGDDGDTWKPSISSEGLLSWSKDSGTPTSVNIKGKTGPVWLPEVDGEGDLTWTLDDGQTEPEPVNIKGPQGDVAAIDYEELAQHADVVGITTRKFEQAQAMTVWEIQHNLGFFPSVAAVTYGGNHVIGEVSYIDENSLTVAFTVELSGYAYLS